MAVQGADAQDRLSVDDLVKVYAIDDQFLQLRIESGSPLLPQTLGQALLQCRFGGHRCRREPAIARRCSGQAGARPDQVPCRRHPLTVMRCRDTLMMKAMTVFPLSPAPSPARGEGSFVSRLRDFHIKRMISGLVSSRGELGPLALLAGPVRSDFAFQSVHFQHRDGGPGGAHCDGHGNKNAALPLPFPDACCPRRLDSVLDAHAFAGEHPGSRTWRLPLQRLRENGVPLQLLAMVLTLLAVPLLFPLH
jgi:hypothetical protein